jgi:hypothetical protein
MRVLLDENIDKSLFDKDFDVVTVPEQGWSGTKNGKLLALAAETFDIFVTMDKNLQHQQNLGDIDLAVIVIRAYNNSFAVVSKLMPTVNEALRKAEVGIATHIKT